MGKVSIGSRITLEYGFPVRVNQENVGKFPVYGSNGITGSIDSYKIKGPGIIVGRKGSVGKVVFSQENFTPTDTAYYLIVKDDSVDDLKFWFYFLPLLGVEKLNSHSAVPGLSRELAYLIECEIPIVGEQRKIGKVLSLIDEKIELNTRINSELESMAKTLYEYWFVQFDFPDINSKPYKTSGGKMTYNSDLKREIPEEWELVPIEYFADIIDPHPSHRAPKEVQNGFPFAGIGDIDESGNIAISKARMIDEEFVAKQEKDYKIGEYSIGYGRVGTVGKVVRLKKQKFRYALSPTLSVINPKTAELAGYVYTSIKSEDFYKQVLKNMSGTTRPAIGIQLLRKIPVLKPSAKHNVMFEQFEKITKELFEKSSIVNQENQNLIELRDWLLPMLMNGQVTVK